MINRLFDFDSAPEAVTLPVSLFITYESHVFGHKKTSGRLIPDLMGVFLFLAGKPF
jgi:hypothetical protein